VRKFAGCLSPIDTVLQDRSQVLRFGMKNKYLGGKIFFTICLKQIFLDTTKFLRAPECPPGLRACHATFGCASKQHIANNVLLTENNLFIKKANFQQTRAGFADRDKKLWRKLLLQIFGSSKCQQKRHNQAELMRNICFTNIFVNLMKAKISIVLPSETVAFWKLLLTVMFTRTHTLSS